MMTDLIAEERPPRLPGYDYSQAGAYFITICTKDREPLFWSSPVGPQGMEQLSVFGQIVAEQWLKSAEIRKEVSLGEWVVMPDHFHGILLLDPGSPVERSSVQSPVGQSPVGPPSSVGAYGHTPPQRMEEKKAVFRSPSKTVGAMVRGFKGAVTTAINTIRQTPGRPVWQSNFYEHIIRNDAAFQRISAYIRNNPFVGLYGHTAPQKDLKQILETSHED